MTTEPQNISSQAAKELRLFCDLCQWAYDYWITYYFLFEEMPDRIENKCEMSLQEFLEAPYGSCFNRLNTAIQDYCILEIAKLHDSACQYGNKNLSINYVAKQKFWSKEEKKKINSLVSEMNCFYAFIKPARDKILAHNDAHVYVKFGGLYT